MKLLLVSAMWANFKVSALAQYLHQPCNDIYMHFVTFVTNKRLNCSCDEICSCGVLFCNIMLGNTAVKR